MLRRACLSHASCSAIPPSGAPHQGNSAARRSRIFSVIRSCEPVQPEPSSLAPPPPGGAGSSASSEVKMPPKGGQPLSSSTVRPTYSTVKDQGQCVSSWDPLPPTGTNQSLTVVGRVEAALVAMKLLVAVRWPDLGASDWRGKAQLASSSGLMRSALKEKSGLCGTCRGLGYLSKRETAIG